MPSITLCQRPMLSCTSQLRCLYLDTRSMVIWKRTSCLRHVNRDAATANSLCLMHFAMSGRSLYHEIECQGSYAQLFDRLLKSVKSPRHHGPFLPSVQLTF